jgi:alpha-glucosidase (family GH31 glycosyl hydrolase)
MWTGDNKSTYDDLKVNIPMLLSLGISGIQFSGSDIPGFTGNPTSELYIMTY